MNPTVGETNWSTETRSPGDVIFIGCSCAGVLDLHALRVALAYMHAEHTGVGHLANLLGITPILAICFNLVNEI